MSSFTIQLEPRSDHLLVHLTGAIDENVQLLESIERGLPAPGRRIRLSAKRVERFNSVGIRTWIKTVRELVSRGNEVLLIECSPAVIEQLNAIANFASGARVESLCLPYSCASCKSSLQQLATVERVLEFRAAPPELKCPKCQGVARFDEFPEEFFLFIDRALQAREDSTAGRGIPRPPSTPPKKRASG